ncbi:MAG: ABC transporter permease, partial [Chloroflexi bacterium]|nr:ABC transporter permease [Chloroflexota bacterium]
LSGVFFPIDMMPDFIRPIIEVLPLTYLADSFRQVMVEASPFHPMMFNVIVMSAWLIICMGISIRFFRWE